MNSAAGSPDPEESSPGERPAPDSPWRISLLGLIHAIILIVALYCGCILLFGASGYGTPLPFWQHPPHVIVFHAIAQISPSLTMVLQLILLWGTGLGLWFVANEITRKNVLEHQIRTQIYFQICESPGIYYRELERCTGLNRGTLAHHLDKLERTHKITAQEQGGHLHYFQNSGTYSALEQALLAECRKPRRKQILLFLRDFPSDREVVARECGISFPAAAWHLSRLTAAGVVRAKKIGRRYCYFLDGNTSRLLQKWSPDPVHEYEGAPYDTGGNSPVPDEAG